MDILTRNRQLARGVRPASQAQIDQASSADSLRNGNAVMLLILANDEQAFQEEQEAAAGQAFDGSKRVSSIVAEGFSDKAYAGSSYGGPNPQSEDVRPPATISIAHPLASYVRPPATLSIARPLAMDVRPPVSELRARPVNAFGPDSCTALLAEYNRLLRIWNDPPIRTSIQGINIGLAIYSPSTWGASPTNERLVQTRGAVGGGFFLGNQLYNQIDREVNALRVSLMDQQRKLRQYGCRFSPAGEPVGVPTPATISTVAWVAGTAAAATVVGGLVYVMSRPKKSGKRSRKK